jgi:Na+-driven multidrug efflux pump
MSELIIVAIILAVAIVAGALIYRNNTSKSEAVIELAKKYAEQAKEYAEQLARKK